MKTGSYSAAVALALFGMVSTASGASFDCKKARSFSERTICADPELSRLDDHLGALYNRARQGAGDQHRFAAENSAEWARREQNCQDRPCLMAWYASRRTQLEAYVGQPAAEKAAIAARERAASSTAAADVDLIAAQQAAVARRDLADRAAEQTDKLKDQLVRKTVALGRSLYLDLKAAGMAFGPTQAGIDNANYSSELNGVGTYVIDQQLDGGRYVEVRKAFLWSVERHPAFAPAGMRMLVALEGYPAGELVDPSSAGTSPQCRWTIRATRGIAGTDNEKLGTWGCGPLLYGLVDDEVKAAAKRFIQAQLLKDR